MLYQNPLIRISALETAKFPPNIFLTAANPTIAPLLLKYKMCQFSQRYKILFQHKYMTFKSSLIELLYCEPCFFSLHLQLNVGGENSSLPSQVQNSVDKIILNVTALFGRYFGCMALIGSLFVWPKWLFWTVLCQF